MNTRHLPFRCLRGALAVVLLLLVCEQGTGAQKPEDRSGFALREFSLSTGYAFVQLPPITLGGKLPDDVLNEDLIASGTAGIEWRRVTPRTHYRFELLGTYMARTRYSKLSAPGGDLTFGVSRAVGTRWRLGAGYASAITSSDKLAFQSTPVRRLIDESTSYEDLSASVAHPRSPSPDANQAALFVPIDQSLVASDLQGVRMMASSVKTNATYAHSVRLATYLRGSYTAVRPISSNDTVLAATDSSVRSAGLAIRYDRSERTQLTGAIDWSQASGASVDNIVIATLGYGWSGRKWFTAATLGAAVRPFRELDAATAVTGSGRPEVVYGAALGYKFRTQTLLAQYSRAAHDEYGNGGRDVTTGFEGNVQSVVGSWVWSAPRGRWLARADFSMIRRPGNFSYINAWLSSVGIGRQLTPNVRLSGEVLFDRHGSRAFEGFHLAREGARVNVTWSPPRRPID